VRGSPLPHDRGSKVILGVETIKAPRLALRLGRFPFVAGPKASTDPTADYFETSFRAGNPLAVDECVLSCHASAHAPPTWAMDQLAKRARANIADTLARAAKLRPRLPPVGPYAFVRSKLPKDKGGRGGRYIDYADQSALVCAVSAAKDYGLKGYLLYVVVSEALRHYDVIYTPESAQKLYPGLRKQLEPHPTALAFWVEDIERALAEVRKANVAARVPSTRRR
jgi:hypothetical protein